MKLSFDLMDLMKLLTFRLMNSMLNPFICYAVFWPVGARSEPIEENWVCLADRFGVKSSLSKQIQVVGVQKRKS